MLAERLVEAVAVAGRDLVAAGQVHGGVANGGDVDGAVPNPGACDLDGGAGDGVLR